ncbi:MAG: hypothetical protein O3C39_08825 [Planctomycetota bacterium]|jgi:hypothetical protein|nr:hypothetical protein [Planctomycetota bacterium]MDA1201772.1 hypothetical protein [Planctomycetota bacterium]
MRDQLVGYLFDALDEGEARDVEAALADPAQGPALRNDLELLRRAVSPLVSDRGPEPAPAGLARRTLTFVEAQSTPATVPLRPLSPVTEGSSAGRRVWLDRLLLAASAVAACVLIAPLVADAITDSRARRVERRLQTIASGLEGYAEHHGIFPTPPDGGPLSRAGLYAPTLVSEHRLVADDGTLLVPGSDLDRRGGFRVPTLDELEAAVGTARFDELINTMGGDFGYTLGHRGPDGRLQPNRNQGRSHHPIVADAPGPCCEKSNNHPDGIHYILFEDGHFKRVAVDALHGEDHLYRNHEGEVAAGIDAEDAVIGDSHHQP